MNENTAILVKVERGDVHKVNVPYKLGLVLSLEILNNFNLLVKLSKVVVVGEVSRIPRSGHR